MIMLNLIILYIIITLINSFINIYQIRESKSVLESDALHAYTIDVVIQEFTNFIVGLVLVTLSALWFSGWLLYALLLISILIAKSLASILSNLYLKHVYHIIDMQNREKALGSDNH